MKLAKPLILALVLSLAIPAASLAWTPNDPYYGNQWGFGAINMSSAWDMQFGGRSDVKVAVLDSGVAWDIADFQGTKFDKANAWDFVYNDNTPNDPNGHGTHVTGTIAQATNNGGGTAGVAFNTTILPVRVLDGNGTSSGATLAKGIRYAVDKGADIINLSLSSLGGDSAVQSACQYAYDSGVLVVAAAGNSSNSRVVYQAEYPAYYNTTLVVGALKSDYSVASYSNAAWDTRGAGLVAPGSDILQANKDGSYSYLSGTSMAAPSVSGVAALVLAEAYDNGYAVPEKNSGRVNWLRDILVSSAQDLGPAGYDVEYGSGLLRADYALGRVQ